MRGVAAKELDEVWHIVSPQIERIIKIDDRFSLQGVYNELKRGVLTLVLFGKRDVELIQIIQICPWHTKTTAQLVMTAGRNLRYWLKEGLPYLEEWLRRVGCSEEWSESVPGVARLMLSAGFEDTGRKVMRKKL